ncbi:LAGLIDADG family homing endonuclease [Blautia faecis]|uniref:LAGLIDADG family homing endonuclease n=1 Tax=Blautia faecis TaxID=871665 RepID=UPI0028A40321|nr:LAGLIDADG family homing endonuclease [Blautia faecis]MDT4368421.1 LAGLIDADG family homing endonuclease [Blautia faecis]
MYSGKYKQELKKHFNEIVELQKSGMQLKIIAEKFNVPSRSIGRLLLENGIYTRTKVSDIDEKDIINDYLSPLPIHKIAEKYKISQSTVSEILKRNNVEIIGSEKFNQKYTLNEHYFDEIDNQEKAYIIGLLMADGCVHKNTISISLQEDDKYILEKINSLLGSNRPIKPINMKKKKITYKNQYKLSIVNKYMANQLRNLGIVNQKSLKLEYPEWVSNNLLPHLIRGYLDGDGSIIKTRNRVSLTGTCMFLYKLKDVLYDTLNIESTIYKYNDITCDLKINNIHNTKIFLDYIYNNSTIHLKRKYEVYISRYVNNSFAA